MSREDYIRRTYGGTKKASPSYVGSSSSNNNNNNNRTKIRDTKVEEESFERELAKQKVFEDQRKSYTRPSKEYGPPKGQGRSYINLYDLDFDNETIKALTAGLSPKTMGFFGYTPGMANMPVQLYQMLIEGSLTNTLDYFADKDLETDGIQFGNEDLTGTYSELEKGTHSMFPGGLQQYYDEMSMPKFQPLGDSYGGGGGSSYFGGGTGRDGLGYGVAATGGPQANSYQRGKVAPGTLQEQVNQVYLGMSGLRKARGGIVSLVE
jgi:hypothetical protein